MEIKKENVVNAYMVGDNSVKEMLRAMFPDIEFESDNGAENRPIMERVKTFEDACRELDFENPLVVAYNIIHTDTFLEDYVEKAQDLIAFLKLRIVCAALNEGWEPQFAKKDDIRWYPLHSLWTSEELKWKDDVWKRNKHLISTGDYNTEYAGFAFDMSSIVPSNGYATLSSRLCLKNQVLSDYCGKQFIELWADFTLIRR